MRRYNKRIKLNNKGAALISVLVVTTFITIIATTMLYMSVVNYQQKQVDYQNKQSFYGAEKALDEFRRILVQDVQDAYVEAYNEVAKNYLLQASDRDGYFQNMFMEALNKKWAERTDPAVITADRINALPPLSADTMSPSQKLLLGAVYKLMEDKGIKDYVENANCVFYKIDSYGAYSDASSGTKKFALKGIQVKCTMGNYTTFLYTDICLEPPHLNWVDNYSTDIKKKEDGSPDKKDIERIAFTDYVYYVNWHKADYDERETYKSDNWTTPAEGSTEPESTE